MFAEQKENGEASIIREALSYSDLKFILRSKACIQETGSSWKSRVIAILSIYLGVRLPALHILTSIQYCPYYD